MEMAKDLVKSTLDEVDRLLSSKTVVGEPMQIGDQTVVPLRSIGFGFGAGGGSGSDGNGGAAEGGGSDDGASTAG